MTKFMSSGNSLAEVGLAARKGIASPGIGTEMNLPEKFGVA